MRVWGAWLLAGLFGPASASAADPSILWKIVSGQCVPHAQQAQDPAPCAVVAITAGVDKGYVVMKDIRGVAQYLVIPTARIHGIEAPELLRPEAVNYWGPAWAARSFVYEKLPAPLPREATSLAINSTQGRSQDQLHIHVDCVRPDVRDALARHVSEVTTTWAPFPERLAGHQYRAIRVNQETLDGVNLFRLLADADSKAAAEMGRHTLAAIGATFPDSGPGFVVLDDQVDLLAADFASAEELQDHACKVAGL
jgi:CDP-diacylglycerol pyrophosphatase